MNLQESISAEINEMFDVASTYTEQQTYIPGYEMKHFSMSIKNPTVTASCSDLEKAQNLYYDLIGELDMLKAYADNIATNYKKWFKFKNWERVSQAIKSFLEPAHEINILVEEIRILRGNRDNVVDFSTYEKTLLHNASILNRYVEKGNSVYGIHPDDLEKICIYITTNWRLKKV